VVIVQSSNFHFSPCVVVYVFHDAKFREETHWSERRVPSRVFSNGTWNIQLQIYDQTAWQAGKIAFAIYIFIVKSF